MAWSMRLMDLRLQYVTFEDCQKAQGFVEGLILSGNTIVQWFQCSNFVTTKT